MPSWKELKRFCHRDEWELYKQTDHYYFRKRLPDGTLLKTKVSMGSGQIHPPLWERILKDQLQVTLEYFNSMI